MSVEWVPFGELFHLERRLPDFQPGELRAEIGLRSFGKGPFRKPKVTLADLGSKRVFEIREGDLLLSNIFAWEGAVGLAGSAEHKLIGSHRFMTWVPKSQDVYTPFVRDYLLASQGLISIGQASPGSAGRNRTLGVEALRHIKVPVPDLETQQEVAGRLNEYARVSQCIQEVSYPKRALERSVWATVDGAVTVPLRHVVDHVVRREKVKSEHKYRLLGVRWYGEGAFVRETKPGSEIKASYVYRVLPGDIIYNRLFAWKGSFALMRNEEAHASNEFPTFVSDDSAVLPEFVEAWLHRPYVHDLVEARSTGSTPTSRNRFKVDDFLSLDIPLPPMGTQRLMVDKFRALREGSELGERRKELANALLPAARNEAFRQLLAG